MKNPFLIGDKIYLRSPEPGDEHTYVLAENHPDPRQRLYSALPTSIETHKERIQERLKDHHTILFTVSTIDPDQAIGVTALFRIDWIGRMAVFYLAIAAKEHWSKGYGSEVTRLMVDYAFRNLNLNRIQLHVSAENTAAIKIYEQTGFKKEGTLRQAMYFNGQYIDFFVMAILREDWEKIRQ